MTDNLTALTITAASVGFIHTLLGPDHYLPFIVMARCMCMSIRINREMIIPKKTTLRHGSCSPYASWVPVNRSSLC